MDSFLFIGDYLKQIQSDNLNQVIGYNQAVLDAAQSAAIEECKSFLKQKFDISEVFKPVSQWDRTKTYKAGQTVYLNAPAYDKTKTYALNSLVIYTNNCYQCTTAITIAEEFNASKWLWIGAQYSTFYAVTPQPEFNYLNHYAKGDKVFYKDKVYTCQIPSGVLDHAAQLEIGSPVESAIVNVFPDDPVKGSPYWGSGVAYSVAANTEILNTDYWLQGDARDQKLLQICIDICLYHAHSRISPRNIPEQRVIRYKGEAQDRIYKDGKLTHPLDSALGWLEGAATGRITPDMPVIQPLQGKRIRYGGNIKLTNTY